MSLTTKFERNPLERGHQIGMMVFDFVAISETVRDRSQLINHRKSFRLEQTLDDLESQLTVCYQSSKYKMRVHYDKMAEK